MLIMFLGNEASKPLKGTLNWSTEKSSELSKFKKAYITPLDIGMIQLPLCFSVCVTYPDQGFNV